MSPVQSAGAARRWAIGLLVCVAAAGGCNSNATLVQPPSFNRPGQMVLTCYDTVAKHVVPADRCDGVEGKSSETVVLTAVVTQERHPVHVGQREGRDPHHHVDPQQLSESTPSGGRGRGDHGGRVDHLR